VKPPRGQLALHAIAVFTAVRLIAHNRAAVVGAR